MSTKQEWIALAERCERATGPNFKTECDIGAALGVDGIPRPYTASLDAITALIERELPDWRVRWHTDGDGVHEAFLENKGDFGAIEARHTESYAATPALALCAAFCRAMAGKAGE